MKKKSTCSIRSWWLLSDTCRHKESKCGEIILRISFMLFSYSKCFSGSPPSPGKHQTHGLDLHHHLWVTAFHLKGDIQSDKLEFKSYLLLLLSYITLGNFLSFLSLNFFVSNHWKKNSHSLSGIWFWQVSHDKAWKKRISTHKTQNSYHN